MNYAAPKGTYDIYAPKVALWHRLEKIIRELCRDFRAEEIRTPVFEHTELFLRSVGETTDIVQKEMFTFEDAGGRSLTLKPEGTAGVARAYIENGFHNLPQPVKLYYVAPSFRAERPQKGRFRQLHQFGVEIFGSAAPSTDAELISLAWEFFRRAKITGLELKINSIGDSESRAVYNKKLLEYLNANSEKLCNTCKERMLKNPLRVLDCKVEGCKGIVENAPVTLDYLRNECVSHFEGVKSFLSAMDIPYTVDPKIVRGLDYYTRTVFEIHSNALGAQSAVCGGGRYDNMIEECGGASTCAVGFGIGLDRAVIILEEQNALASITAKTDIFIGAMGSDAVSSNELLLAQSLVFKLRQAGFSAETDSLLRSVKSQFRYADKIGAKFSVMIGGEELLSKKANIKNMETGEQENILLEADELASFLRRQKS